MQTSVDGSSRIVGRWKGFRDGQRRDHINHHVGIRASVLSSYGNPVNYIEPPVSYLWLNRNTGRKLLPDLLLRICSRISVSRSRSLERHCQTVCDLVCFFSYHLILTRNFESQQSCTISYNVNLYQESELTINNDRFRSKLVRRCRYSFWYRQRSDRIIDIHEFSELSWWDASSTRDKLIIRPAD